MKLIGFVLSRNLRLEPMLLGAVDSIREVRVGGVRVTGTSD